MSVRLHVKTSPQGVDWTTLEETWSAIGESPVFEGAWLNDHLTDPALERGGSSFEAWTTLTALAHRVGDRTVGHIVLSNTFRHPAVLAKAATTLDHVTGGRFVLALGAGWHEHEHADYGVELPAIGERMSRLEAAVRVFRALHSPAAATDLGVTLDDPRYPLHGAVNLPPPLTAGGPKLWLGGQGPRGLRLAAEQADGWVVPSLPYVDPETFGARRSYLLSELERLGRDGSTFRFSAQVPSGADDASRAHALELATAFAAAGATDLVLALPASLGVDGLARLTLDVALPLRDRLG